MAFAEDLSVFFNTAELAVDATFDGATPVVVIFDRAYLAQLGVAGTNPAALAKASDFPDVTCIGKNLQIGADVWKILDRQPQDDGAIVLLQLRA